MSEAVWLDSVCRSEHPEDRLVCYNYLKGVREGAEVTQTAFDDPPVICPPATANTEQLRRVVIHYLEQHPDELHLAPYVVAIFAIRDAWPCQQN